MLNQAPGNPWRQVGHIRLRYATWLVALALFLAAQTIALLHAEIHPFHEHTQLCDVLEKAADPRVDSPSFTVALSKFSMPVDVQPVYRFVPPLAVYAAFQSRAPPSISV
ncbi:hypothetical protein [Thiosulfatimonas sediminis]|nr:hypothetical protein [Thiosulfatimonas sediminis]